MLIFTNHNHARPPRTRHIARTLILSVVALSLALGQTLQAVTQAEIDKAWAAGDWDKVNAMSETLIKAGGDDRALGWRLRSLLAMREGDSEKGVEYAEKAMKAGPESAQMQLHLGNAYAQRVNDVSIWKKGGVAKKIKAAYERAYELDPENPEVLRSLIGFHREAPSIAGGDKERAEEIMQELWKVAPVDAAYTEAPAFIEAGNYAEARSIYKKAMALLPDDPALIYQLGKLAALSGEHLEEGRQHLETYLTLADPPRQGLPSHGGAYWRLGQIQAKLGDKAAARESLTRAIALEPAIKVPAQADLDKLGN
jgi:tetratricopeptide (TPR) repeat protein